MDREFRVVVGGGGWVVEWMDASSLWLWFGEVWLGGCLTLYFKVFRLIDLFVSFRTFQILTKF
jgi:hypothetical protein